jgi:tetratricopeptide (TPR) repeat protein
MRKNDGNADQQHPGGDLAMKGSMNKNFFTRFFVLVLAFSLFFASAQRSAFAYSSGQYNSVQNPKEKQIQDIRNEEIRAVKTALSLRAPENRKAELYLRLAELYLEAYRADFLLEGRLHEKVLKVNNTAKMERGRSVDDLRFGISAAEQILSLSVDKSKLDKVYYFLGYNYGELGNTEKSLYYYKILGQNYPDSPFAVEGIKALADDAFAKGDFAQAQVQYERALEKTKDPSQQARIYHKLAWCYYRQKRTDDAINAMKKAIAISQTDSQKFLNILEEGLRDIAVYYAESGRVDEAIAYFEANAGGQDKLAKVLEKLGQEYERTGQTEKAIQVYDVLLKLDQKDESSFRVAAKLIDLDLLKQKFDSAYARLQALTIPKSADPDTMVAVVNLRKRVRSTGVNAHDHYRKADDKDAAKSSLLVADKFYTLYLTKFLPNDEASKAERNEVRMYLAEVRRDLNQPGDAAALYKAIITDKDPKYSKEAAQLWVGSLASELKKKADAGEKPGDKPSELEQDFVAASDLLEKSIPDSVESREARLRAAQILAAYPSEKQTAIERASKLAKDAPGTPQGVLAARLWLQLTPDQATVDAITATPLLLETDKKQKGELALDIQAISKNLKVGEIATLEKNKNYLEAGKSYEAFAQQAKTEKEAETAYMGALNAYAQNGSSEEVARVMKDWSAKFPKSALPEKTVKTQATQFFIRGLFNDAAELFLGIGRQFHDYPSYLTSAALFDGGLQPVKARDVYRNSLSLAPNDEDRAKTYRLSAMVANDQKDDLSAFNDWKSCYALNTSLKAECGSQVGNYYLRLNDTKQAKNLFEQVVAINKGPSSKSPYIAYAQFRSAQILEKAMQNVPLQFPVANLLKAFNERVEELKPVSDAYQRAISLGGPWGIAATERLGDLALGLSGEVDRVLSNSNADANLKQALAPVAEALRKKAIDNSLTAYRTAVRQQILSPALPVIHDRLVDAGVDGMYRAQGPRSGIKLIGLSPDGGKAGKDEAMKQTRDHLLLSQDDALSWIDYGNLLWGTGKPGLSKVAYQRALDLKTRMADAMNNLAVVSVSDQGYENWYAANDAIALWKRALGYESSNSAALFNLGHYFNYFRLFELAYPYFDHVSRKVSIGEVHDGLAVSNFGLGHQTEADLEFKKAEELGEKSNRFIKQFVQAARATNKSDCKKALEDVDGVAELKGFEKISYDRLLQRCQ